MSNDEENDRLGRMERKIDRLTLAVLGDREAGALGLVARVDNHSSRLKGLESWRDLAKAKLAAVATVVSGAVAVAAWCVDKLMA
jgi:hypothetical protein